MKIMYIGSYPPRKCGIATFTYDLLKAVASKTRHGSFQVVAMNNDYNGYDYPKEVVLEIQKNNLLEYENASEYINSSDAEIVSLQHEFGLFGGEAGGYLFSLIGNIKKPIVTSLHTVIKEPSKEYRKSMEELIFHSDKLIVMSQMGREILREVYQAPDEKVEMIYHGVPDVSPKINLDYKKDLGIEGRFMLLTFGLLHPGKGIEVVLDSLLPVVKKYPNLAYIVLGATHPEVKKHNGEKYRLLLKKKVNDLGLENNVIFHNRFVNLNELCQYICASDIYISPYLSKEQIVSGALSYAIGMGKAIISTPYWYAQEMLSDNRGLLVDFGDKESLCKALLYLMGNPIKRDLLQKRAYEFGRQMTWGNVGSRYKNIFEQALLKHDIYKIDEDIWGEIGSSQ